ncbi:MAG: GNAT family protein [Anaerolineae bacterium]|nr:GNAT family protein [Anaerolineae bacterium]MDK1080764.1 GNAT family protein [Anaerolineae bacterium]MDK1117930.1 GNAT family protein [Anaerolineae bacterium]
MVKIKIKPVVLTGRHVRLEPMNETHVPGLAAIGMDEGIWDYMLYGDVRSEEDIRRWVKDILSRPDIPFAVVHLVSGEVAGATRYLNIESEHRGLEIGGTWYGLKFQRTAVNTECKYLLLKHAFETLGCIRVQFKTDVRNVRSQRAIERIGATKEGILRNHMVLPDGGYRDSVYYSILDAEWPGVKKDLENKLSKTS